ncbi:MAG: hypothetical protein ACFE9I_14870 [Candidatus Hermodarchaeota archaeon]
MSEDTKISSLVRLMFVLWLLTMVMLWVLFGLMTLEFLFWLALGLTVGGPVLAITYKLKELNAGAVIFAIVLLWVAFGVYGGILLFGIALTLTILGPIIVIILSVINRKKGPKKEIKPLGKLGPLNPLAWLCNLGWLGALGTLYTSLFWLYLLFFLILLGIIPYDAEVPVKRKNRLWLLGFLGFIGFLFGALFYWTWSFTSLFTLFILGILPKKTRE